MIFVYKVLYIVTAVLRLMIDKLVNDTKVHSVTVLTFRYFPVS